MTSWIFGNKASVLHTMYLLYFIPLCIVDVLLTISFVLSLLHVLEHMCMQPPWQPSGLQVGGIGFEFGPENCMVFCLARYNLLVCKLAEKASFHILT
jgi:hypothetical protein